MIQTYGMRRPGGRVRHIVQLEKPVRRYTRAFALCGVPVETMDLADTVGGTCQRCLDNPKFNEQEGEDEA